MVLLIHKVYFLLAPPPLRVLLARPPSPPLLPRLAENKRKCHTTQLRNLVVWIGGETGETHTEIKIFLGWIFNLPCQHFQSLSLSIWHHLCIAVITWDITELYWFAIRNLFERKSLFSIQLEFAVFLRFCNTSL